MESFIGWLDHSEEDQRRVREMLQLFSDKGTVDDLGIGTVRDAISNALFPGTSIIQTRARYFLFVPWIFRRAERRHPHQLVAKASDMERTLIGALKEGGDHAGLIGIDAGRNVRTLPSAIFWGGLIRYGIFLAPSLTIRQYGRHVARGLVAADAEDEIGDRAPSFWQREIPDAPPGFFNFTSANFELTREEAEWLSERVISSDRLARAREPAHRLHQGPPPRRSIEQCRRGLGCHAANRRDGGDRLISCTMPSGFRAPHTVPRSSTTSSSQRRVEKPATRKRRRHRRRTIELRLDEWRADAHRVGVAAWAARIDDFWDCLLDQGARIPPRTRRFIDEWARLLATDASGIASSVTARALVHDRELEHKRGQARLANRKRLDEWAGDAGTIPLTFRWSQVQRMLSDIRGGLHAVESGDHAVA